MEYVKVTEDLRFSRVIAGTMRASREGLSGKKMADFVDRCLDAGVTTFDHADIYGYYESSRLFGEAVLQDHPALRDKMQIVTKFNIILPRKENGYAHYYDSSVKHLNESLDKSLQVLHTDYVDVLLIHRLDPLLNPKELAEGLDRLIKQGKVRHIGISNASYTYFEMVNKYVKTPLVTNQVEVSPLHTDTLFNGVMDSALIHEIPVMAWSPLGGGRLFHPKTGQEFRTREILQQMAEKYGVDSIDKIAYAFIYKLPATVCPVVGSTKFDRVQSAIDARGIELTNKDWFKILEASRGREVL
ncbi:aldo/keto reductase family oxidoreductase [Sporolactobacillus sp. THM19-2]|uniref:aldo/keto reductase n=1 Tax=Sporolactobacillus sp. THM19-2 TaxID=2511171 RepID=UPI00102219E6|nr:aldo/keto reductase [Sporolactobacillus sp. THM19-2]RYL93720.1 aldo/keto reductase [Sporolactobacillus sp. THM19-2]